MGGYHGMISDYDSCTAKADDCVTPTNWHRTPHRGHHGAAHTRHTYLAALYRRLQARRGTKKALVAAGHAILVIIYHILSRKEAYQDLGANYVDERDRQAVQRRLVHRLEQLGYQVTVQSAPTPTEATFSE